MLERRTSTAKSAMSGDFFAADLIARRIFLLSMASSETSAVGTSALSSVRAAMLVLRADFTVWTKRSPSSRTRRIKPWSRNAKSGVS